MADAFGVIAAGDDLASRVRAVVRDALLVAGTLAGEQVETARAAEFTDDDYTAIAIYTPEISREWLGGSPIQFRATVTVAIVGVVNRVHQADAETDADTLRVQIENAVFRSPEFWALPVEDIPTSRTAIQFPDAGDYHRGVVTMTIDVQCTDEFDLNIRPLSGVAAPGAIGEPLDQADITVVTDAGETITGANVTIP